MHVCMYLGDSMYIRTCMYFGLVLSNKWLSKFLIIVHNFWNCTDKFNGSSLPFFLNQVRAGLGRRAPGFLKLILCGSSVCVFVCVCPRPRLLLTSGVMWHDMDLIRLVKQVLQLLYGNCSRYR